MVYLKEILKGVSFKTRNDISSLKVKRIVCDSRDVRKGDIFVAVDGYLLDGHKFIKDAISKGAKAILAQKDFSSPAGIKKVSIDDMRTALPVIAGNFYNHPSRSLKMIGVTGTNGKTTITYLIESILEKAGKKPGVIGTINYRFKKMELPAKNTTPGPLELEEILARILKRGCDYAILEVSSHSLDQHRVDGLLFDTAIFTNVTSEHLDYHKTISGYFKAKAKLFGRLKKRGVSILNADDRRVAGLKDAIKGKVITYGIEAKADIGVRDLRCSLYGSEFFVVTPENKIDIKTGLIGKHNVSNILASIAASLAEGVDLKTIKEGIENLASVPGRLERVDLGRPFTVFVDYAHTEDALNNILGMLREEAKRKIITVFGCGGNRDSKKRPLMGRAACRFSDRVIITSDNPRFENPAKIIKEIEEGLKERFSNYEIIEDRHAAIERALILALKDDIVVIAGKGHEKYQVVNDRMIPFDDCEVVKSILRKR